MRKINKSIILIVLLIILLLLKLILIDNDILSIILSSSFLTFYLLTFINYVRKKETEFQKKILEVILYLLVFIYGIYTGVLLFTGKNIVLSLYYFVILWMMCDSYVKLLIKRDYEAKKIFISAVVMYCLPYLRLINLELIANFVIYILIAIYFNDCKSNYFLLYDGNLVNKNKDKFKWTQWIKTSVLILNGVIYLLCPILGGVIAVFNYLLCFGRFFDKQVLLYEQKLYNKKIRKNKEFIAYRNIYLLTSCKDDFLNKRLEVVAKKTFLQEDEPYEMYALMEVKEIRKKEEVYKFDKDNNQDLLMVLEEMFNKNVRPEVIGSFLEQNLKHKKRVLSKIAKINKCFNDKVIDIINDDKSVNEKLKVVNKLYDEYKKEIRDYMKNVIVSGGVIL